MADFDSDKEERLKIAFSKIKEDIADLKANFDVLKKVISQQQDLLEAFIAEIAKNKANEPNFEVFQGLPETSSSGNEGVQTNKQTNNQTNKQTQNKQTNTAPSFLSTIKEEPVLEHFAPPIEPLQSFSTLKKDILSKFGSLPKREFLIFLTVYQIEDDKGSVYYADVAKHLRLSESGVRHYIFNLIKKGAPLLKRKINNKTTILAVSPEFRGYNIKKELADLYLHLDSGQKTLTDEY
jgi:hypothetical protein